MRDAPAIASPTIKPLDPGLDGRAAVLLAACAVVGDEETAGAMLGAMRADEAATLLGVMLDGELVGVYLLQRVTMANEIRALAVDAGHRRRGVGKMCLYDALLRSGKRPLVVEADDTTLPFFKACGFKLVGKRKGADGAPRYRLGWHAPIPKPGSPGEQVC